MNSAANLLAVQRLHVPDEGGMLQRGSLLDLLADDVAWMAIGPPDRFPWAGVHTGHDGVRRWLHVLNETMAYERFELLEAFGDGDTVVEVIAAEGHARATGRRFASEVVRLWTFREGKAIRVRSYYDTYAYAAALEPTP